MSTGWRTLLYATIFLGAFLGYLPWQVLQLDAAIGQSLQTGLTYVGALLFLAGAALIFSGAYYLALRGEGTPFPLDPPKRMVVAGPYAHVQHPLMLGLLLMVFAEALWFSSLTLGVYAVLLAVLVNFYVTFVEEPGLERRFGDDYRAYRNAVPRWLPFLGKGAE